VASHTVRAPADSIFRTVDAVGDAWGWLIMREAIIDHVAQFGEFRERLGIANATLTARLQQLTRSGLLEPASGPRRYELTPSGEDFFICLMTAMRWGDRWCSTSHRVPLIGTHTACGQRLEPVLCCSKCGAVVDAKAVTERRGVSAQSLQPQPRQRQPDYRLLERVRPCSIARTLRTVGDRWSALVIRESFRRAHRFEDFRARLGVAPNILTNRLTRLVELGILTKVQYQDRPVRHEYRLTDKGLDLYHVPLSQLTWGDRWLTPGEPEMQLTHNPCNSPFTAILTCNACHATITRSDTTFYGPIGARSRRTR
jgi:DNA-binding HxlR family transcriptional regulator